jgi:class 3 adenylate cyclase
VRSRTEKFRHSRRTGLGDLRPIEGVLGLGDVEDVGDPEAPEHTSADPVRGHQGRNGARHRLAPFGPASVTRLRRVMAGWPVVALSVRPAVPYTPTVIREPARGGFPEPSFHSLPGIERARAYLRGMVPRSPFSHLLGYRVGQVGAGIATILMPASPWLQVAPNALDVRILLEEALALAVLTGAPPGHDVRVKSLSIDTLRPCTLDSETVIARARVYHSGPNFTFAEVVVEDVLGRAIAHATGSALVRPVEPPPPPASSSLERVADPAYSSPDPHLRPLPPLQQHTAVEIFLQTGPQVVEWINQGNLISIPLWRFLGMETEVSPGMSVSAVPTSEWLCSRSRHIAPGALIAYAGMSILVAVWTLSPGSKAVGVVGFGISFFRPVVPDGRDLTCRARVVHNDTETAVANVELVDADGQLVAVANQTSLYVDWKPKRKGLSEPERILATVLFTDIVASTRLAEEMGDERWGQVLAGHHALVRRQLQAHKGREVKTTGDGFLATFDVPTRAVHCARAIRDGLRGLGLEIRAGLHTGECELDNGDVSGVAVHIASRIQSAADPGEILVSSTVHDLVSGAGLTLSDRGVHELKGLEGKWQLFAAGD